MVALLSDATVLHYDSGHGTQVEYMSADGYAFLWYPGNQSVVPGEWHIRIGSDSWGPGDESRNELESDAFIQRHRSLEFESTLYLCFRYGSNTYNPLMNMRGGNWECQISPPASHWEPMVHDGDPFGLAQTILVPAELERGPRYTMDDLHTIIEKTDGS